MKSIPEYNGIIKHMRVACAKAKKESKCVAPPYGCGHFIDQDAFRDELSRKEYSISGLCQKCQDKFFNTDEELQFNKETNRGQDS